MRDLNKMELLGTIGKDVQMYESKNGLAIANIPVTTVQTRFDKPSISTYHTVVCFGELAEMASAFKVGDRVFASGKLEKDSYEKEGQRHYVTKLKATHLAKLLSESSDQEKSESKPQGGPPTANFPRGENSKPTVFPYFDKERDVSWDKPKEDGEGCSYVQKGDLLLTCAWLNPDNPLEGGAIYGMKQGDKEWEPMGSLPNVAPTPF
ncbi:MAG TPA: hypothetical protein DEP37_03390 [Algoriphagus sp.]|nr:hypothetical protein [Algoriphagus sp.]